MDLTIIIILCTIITSALIIFPLIISHKAERLKKENEWDKIANYGNKINKKSRNKKLH
jgi:uncharacterized protein YxeA